MSRKPPPCPFHSVISLSTSGGADWIFFAALAFAAASAARGLPNLVPLACCKSRFGALGNHLAFMLGHCREDVNCEPVRAQHIHGDRFNIAVHQAGNEMDVAGEPVKLGDDQRGAALPSLCEGRKELRPVILAPALHFHERGGQLALACHEACNGFALCIHAKPLDALLVRGHPVVSDVFSHFHLPVIFSNDRLKEYTTFPCTGWTVLCRLKRDVGHCDFLVVVTVLLQKYQCAKLGNFLVAARADHDLQNRQGGGLYIR
jgi:hypothetical protein